MIDISNVVGIVRKIPASKDEIIILEKKMNLILPKIYKELLSLSNGFSTDKGVVIYGTEDIIERNLTLEVNEYAKGYIAIGDDSGDIVFLISEDDSKKEILAVGCGDMNPLNAKIISPSLCKWLENNCDLADINQENGSKVNSEKYSILLIENPKGGLKDLVKIKNTINIELSSAELLKASKNIPFILISNISYGKALNYLKKLSEFSEILQLQSLNS